MEAIPWDEGATGLLYSYYYTIIDEGAHRSELWLGDIPAEFGTLKKLSCLLWEATPHGVQQPRVKRLVRKGYRRGAGGRGGRGGGGGGGGDENDWLGYAILSFDSPADASEALKVMDGLAATDSFTFRVKPAEADKKALARAQKARAAGLKPGQDPALSAQLFPLDRTAIVRQLELLTAAAAGRATGGMGGTGDSTGTTGGNRGSVVDAIRTSESGRGVGDADGADGADGSGVGDAGYAGGTVNNENDDNDDDGVGSMRFRFKNRKEALAALLDWYGERPRKDSPGVGFKVPESLLGPLRHQLVSMEWPLELRRLTSESYIVLNFAATAEATVEATAEVAVEATAEVAVKAATTGEVTAEAPAKAPLAPPRTPRADDADGGDGEVVLSLVGAENLLRGRNSVHIKGFGDGMTPVYYLQDALALILPYDTVVWDGDPLKAGGFTALVEVYLAAHPVGIAVAFKPRNAVNAFLHSWQGVIDRYPGRVKVVPVDIRTVTDAFGLHDEVAQSCALLPDWARNYYTLGRAAIKVSGSAKVVSLGGGGIAAREAAAGIREGASWTVFAMGRGKKESHASLCDMAAAHPRVVTLIRGKDPDEALAFSGDCPPITRTRQIELRSNSGKKRMAVVAVPTPVTLAALLDAARQPFKLKRAAAVRLFVVADGHELGEGDPALGSVAIVVVSTGEDFVAREGPPAAADAQDLGKGGGEEEEDTKKEKEKEKGGRDGSEEKGEEEQGLSRRELQNWAKKNGKPWRVNGRSDSADIRRAMSSSMGKGGGASRQRHGGQEGRRRRGAGGAGGAVGAARRAVRLRRSFLRVARRRRV